MKLNKGDTIGIIALSGECDKEKAEHAKAIFEAFGYKVHLSKNIFDKNRYLAGYDEDKVKELESFFSNPDIKLILAARGGYGAIRIINKIDYELIRNNPKPFCGFSDVTALLLMIYKRSGLITYHSPMACPDWGKRQISQITTLNFINAINSEKLAFSGNKIYREGIASGILWGGNLSTIVSLCGQDFLPEKDFIFFAEDLNEPVYKIDRMFQQLINIEDFLIRCKAIVLGDFLKVDNEEYLDDYFKELSKRINIPIVSGFKITHLEEKITLPIGANAKLDKLILKVGI